jgi:hypothetical protein
VANRKKQPPFLVPPARARELAECCRGIVNAVKDAEKRYGVKIVVSWDANIIEVIDPSASLLDGYSYVASIYLDEERHHFEVERLLPEDVEAEQARKGSLHAESN